MLNRLRLNRLLSTLPLKPTLLVLPGLLALAALRYLDQHEAQAGLWFFIGMTLTTGFFHGALDIVLMRREFADLRCLITAVVLYTGSALVVAIFCAINGWLLILALLVMSVWHFGEPYGRWSRASFSRHTWLQRVIVGGAPVMLPILLSTDALFAVLPLAVGQDAAPSFILWKSMAWLWLGLCACSLALFRQRLFNKSLFGEVGLVFVFNVLLSPLMAFALYFGVVHAGAHIFRVLAKYRSDSTAELESEIHIDQSQSTVVAILITSLATLGMLCLRVWLMHGGSIFIGEKEGLLNSVLVALTALTLPHLVLVSRNSRWLTSR